VVKSNECVKSASSLAYSQDLGQLLLHTQPGQKDVSRSLFLGFLCMSPGLLMLFIFFTAENNIDAWGFAIVGLFILGGFLAAAFFCVRAFKKRQHRIFLYEHGLVENRANVSHCERYENLEIYHTSVQVTAYGVVPLAHARDYKLQFPDGSHSSIDWSHHRRPVGEVIQEQICQALLPRAIAAFNEGQDVVFGPVCLNQREIRIENKAFLWSEVDRVQLAQGTFYAYRTGRDRVAARIDYHHVPNAPLLYEVLKRLGR